MKLTKPQRRALATLKDGNSKEVWRINMESGSHSSGYRVIQALYEKRLIAAVGKWYRITDAGRAALNAE